MNLFKKSIPIKASLLFVSLITFISCKKDEIEDPLILGESRLSL